MIKEGKLLALITARGGSKRLPKKNILKLANKPLIAWTIEASLKSPYIDEVIVSTDDVEIAEISRSYGADVPFIRPPELATENASSIDLFTQFKSMIALLCLCIVLPFTQHHTIRCIWVPLRNYKKLLNYL